MEEQQVQSAMVRASPLDVVISRVDTVLKCNLETARSGLMHSSMNDKSHFIEPG